MCYIAMRFARGPLTRPGYLLGLEALGRDYVRREPRAFCVRRGQADARLACLAVTPEVDLVDQIRQH